MELYSLESLGRPSIAGLFQGLFLLTGDITLVMNCLGCLHQHCPLPNRIGTARLCAIDSILQAVDGDSPLERVGEAWAVGAVGSEFQMVPAW